MTNFLNISLLKNCIYLPNFVLQSFIFLLQVIFIALIMTFLFKKDSDFKHFEACYGKMVFASMSEGKTDECLPLAQ